MDTAYSDPEEFLRNEGLIIPLDKPMDWTSFDAVNKVRTFIRYQFHIPRLKVGHAGTLDPLATGLLLICAGKATQQISRLQELTKTYQGIFQLGSSTPSLDAETEVSEVLPTGHITPGMIKEAARTFEGDIMQVPPAYSAIKHEGTRAYRMARKNEEVNLSARLVRVHEFKVLDIKGDQVHFSISCSKGTYIRAIARDLGKALGTCAYLAALRRTSIGHYSVDEAFSIETLHKAFQF